ncbi:MAG: hypothetical protein UT00_C0019G0006 [Parcubacteria group bacterium GW2011_GWA1_38_7]|nr:MAG: hypothetical protein UT00_C0019G0006 [Parcubacteria group bacterium GW2011_GWA1_38_7]
MNKSTAKQVKVWDKTWNEMLEKGTFPEMSSYQRQWHKNLIKVVAQNINLNNAKSMLECGCGNGIFGLEFANRFPKMALYLSDLSEAALKYNKLLLNEFIRKNPKENFGTFYVNHNIDDMFKMKYKNGFFDVVINGGTLEHYGNKEISLLIKEMLRVTKSSGTVVVAVPNIKNFDLIFKKIKLFIRNNSRGLFLRTMIDYGGNDERDITFNKFKKIVGKNEEIESVTYIKHPLALPRFIPRSTSNNHLMILLEKILVNLGFNWANIFLIKKK